MPHSVCFSAQRLFLIGPQHTTAQLRTRFMGLRRPQQGGSSVNVLLVSKSLVVTSAMSCTISDLGDFQRLLVTKRLKVSFQITNLPDFHKAFTAGAGTGYLMYLI